MKTIITTLAAISAATSNLFAQEFNGYISITQHQWIPGPGFDYYLPMPEDIYPLLDSEDERVGGILVHNGDLPDLYYVGEGIKFDEANKTISVDEEAYIPRSEMEADWAQVEELDQRESDLETLIATKQDASSAFSGSYADLTGKPVLFDGTWGSLSGKPSTFTPSEHAHSWADITSGKPTTLSGYGITDGFTTANARSSISLTTTGSGAASYNSSTGVLNVPTPATPAALAFANPARTLNSAFQIDASRNTIVSYAVDIAATLTLTGGATGTVTLAYADDSGFTTNVVTVQSSVNGNAGALTVGLNLTQTATASLNGVIPAGKYVRIATANTVGAPVFTFRAAQEVKL